MAGLRNALLGVPVAVLIVVGIFAATPVLATCGGHDEAVTSAIRRCPRALELLGDDAHPVRMGLACGSTEISAGRGFAQWELPYTGSRGRGTVRFAAEKYGGEWMVDQAVLESGSESIDIVACGGGASRRPGEIAQTTGDAATATFEGKVIRSTHPTILSGSTCTGLLKRERDASTAHVFVTCKAGVGEAGGAAPAGAIVIYDGDGTFSMDVGDPSRREDDRSELEDAKTSDQDTTPGCRLSSAGDQGTLVLWDTAPAAYEIVVML